MLYARLCVMMRDTVALKESGTYEEKDRDGQNLYSSVGLCLSSRSGIISDYKYFDNRLLLKHWLSKRTSKT